MFLHSVLEQIVDGHLLYCPGAACLPGAYPGVGAFHSTRQNSYLGAYPGDYGSYVPLGDPDLSSIPKEPNITNFIYRYRV